MSVAERLSALTAGAARPVRGAAPPAAASRPRSASCRRRCAAVTGPAAAGDWPLSIDQERLWRIAPGEPRPWSPGTSTPGAACAGRSTCRPWRRRSRELVRRHAAWRTHLPGGRRPAGAADRGVGRAGLRGDRRLGPAAELRERRRGAAPCSTARGSPSTWSAGRWCASPCVRLGGAGALLPAHGAPHRRPTGSPSISAFRRADGALRARPRRGRRRSRAAGAVPGLRRLGARAVERRDAAGARRVLAATELAGFPLGPRPARRPPPPAGAEPARRHDPVHLRPRAGPAAARPRPPRGGDDVHGPARRRRRPALPAHRPGEAGGRLQQRQPAAAGAGAGRRPVSDPGAVRRRPRRRSDLPRAARAGQKSSLAAYTHQNMPFDKLVEVLRPEPDPSRNPVVQVLLLVLAGQSHGGGGASIPRRCRCSTATRAGT